MVKNLPAMQETWIWSLGWEDALEEGMATSSSILSWRIPKDRGAWWVTVHGVEKSRTLLNDSAQHSKNACFLNRDHRCTDMGARCNTGRDFNHLASESHILLKADWHIFTHLAENFKTKEETRMIHSPVGCNTLRALHFAKQVPSHT